MRELLRRIRRFFTGEVDESELEKLADHRVDSMTAVDDTGGADSNVPPGYVKSYDEGRPPH